MRPLPVEIEHKGHKIVFSESSDKWRCADFGFEDSSVAAIKKKIDAKSLAERSMRVPALKLERKWQSSLELYELVEVVITSICEGRFDREPDECWTVNAGDRKSRNKVYLRDLYDPSAREEIDAYLVLHEAAKEASSRAEKAAKALPKFTAAKLRAAANPKSAT